MKEARRATAAVIQAAKAPRQPALALPYATRDQHVDQLLEQFHIGLQVYRIEQLNEAPFSHPENLHKLEATFGPMERWLDQQVATGESDCWEDGTVVLRPAGDTHYYPVGDAFVSAADTYSLVAENQRIPDLGNGLRDLGVKINSEILFDLEDVRAAKTSLEWMRSVTMSLSPRTLHPFTQIISSGKESLYATVSAK